jgi:adenylate kinase
MNRGELVPDAIMVGIVEERLSQPDCHDGFLLDGFPRTIAQVMALKEMLQTTGTQITAAISLEVPHEELIRRLSGRRTCHECGKMYHVELSPPRVEGQCDQCGNQLCQRKDDHEDTISARLEVYRRQTEPILEFFRDSGLLRDVNGLGDSQQVHERILAVLSPAEFQ